MARVTKNPDTLWTVFCRGVPRLLIVMAVMATGMGMVALPFLVHSWWGIVPLSAFVFVFFALLCGMDD